MPFQSLVRIMADGGQPQRAERHIECRQCGQNLSAADEQCSRCGSEEQAVYDLSDPMS
jgi:ribosomal protein L37E